MFLLLFAVKLTQYIYLIAKKLRCYSAAESEAKFTERGVHAWCVLNTSVDIPLHETLFLQS